MHRPGLDVPRGTRTAGSDLVVLGLDSGALSQFRGSDRVLGHGRVLSKRVLPDRQPSRKCDYATGTLRRTGRDSAALDQDPRGTRTSTATFPSPAPRGTKSELAASHRLAPL